MSFFCDRKYFADNLLKLKAFFGGRQIFGWYQFGFVDLENIKMVAPRQKLQKKENKNFNKMNWSFLRLRSEPVT